MELVSDETAEVAMGRRRLTVRRYGFTACSAVALVAFVGIFEAGPSGAKAAVTGPLSPQVTLAPQTTLPAGAEALGPQNGTTPIQGDVVLNSKNQAGLATSWAACPIRPAPSTGSTLRRERLRPSMERHFLRCRSRLLVDGIGPGQRGRRPGRPDGPLPGIL